MKSAFLSAALLGSIAFGQSLNTQKPGEGEATEVAKSSNNPFTFEGELNFTNQYMFRGFSSGDHGLFFQPEATLTYEAYSNDTFTVKPYVSVWNNITDKKYSGMDYWDEFDALAGVNVDVGNFTIGFGYLFYNSPTNNFRNTHEVGLSLSFDDSDYIPIALNPYASVYQELENNNKDKVGTYFELGIAPEYKIESLPLTFTVPVVLGSSLNNYYEDKNGGNEFFGYASIAVTAKYDLTDNWYIQGGVEYLQLLANDARVANGGSANEWIYTVGVGFSF